MNIPIEIFFIVASLAGAGCGALGVHVYYRLKLNRMVKESWRQAKIFYSHATEKP